MAFVYKRRDPSTVEARASASNGDFKSFIKNDYTLYTTRKGDNWIRILPPSWDDAEHYGLDVYVHYGIGPENASVICNSKMTGGKERCPICEARHALERRGAPEDEVNDLKPSRRVLVWLIDRKEEEKGCQLWAMPFSVDQSISKMSRDVRTGEVYAIDDPDEGYDITFDKTGEKMQTKYGPPQIARKPSSVAEKYLEYISQNTLFDTLEMRDYAEVKEIYEGGGILEEPVKDKPRDEPKPVTRREIRREEPAHDPETGEIKEEPKPVTRREIRREEPPVEDKPKTMSRADELRARFAKR